MRSLIDALREGTVAANIATVPVPLGEPIERFPLPMTPERAKKPKTKKRTNR